MKSSFCQILDWIATEGGIVVPTFKCKSFFYCYRKDSTLIILTKGGKSFTIEEFNFFDLSRVSKSSRIVNYINSLKRAFDIYSKNNTVEFNEKYCAVSLKKICEVLKNINFESLFNFVRERLDFSEDKITENKDFSKINEKCFTASKCFSQTNKMCCFTLQDLYDLCSPENLMLIASLFKTIRNGIKDKKLFSSILKVVSIFILRQYGSDFIWDIVKDIISRFLCSELQD